MSRQAFSEVGGDGRLDAGCDLRTVRDAEDVSRDVLWTGDPSGDDESEMEGGLDEGSGRG